MTATSQPQTLRRYGLPESAIDTIQRLLVAHPQEEQVIIDGFRAIGSNRPASDIDLTLIGAAISLATLGQIDAEIDDLLLPWMIELSRHGDLSQPSLLDHIERV